MISRYARFWNRQTIPIEKIIMFNQPFQVKYHLRKLFFMELYVMPVGGKCRKVLETSSPLRM